jgi:hypothetical protein
MMAYTRSKFVRCWVNWVLHVGLLTLTYPSFDPSQSESCLEQYIRFYVHSDENTLNHITGCL